MSDLKLPKDVMGTGGNSCVLVVILILCVLVMTASVILPDPRPAIRSWWKKLKHERELQVGFWAPIPQFVAKSVLYLIGLGFMGATFSDIADCQGPEWMAVILALLIAGGCISWAFDFGTCIVKDCKRPQDRGPASSKLTKDEADVIWISWVKDAVGVSTKPAFPKNEKY